MHLDSTSIAGFDRASRTSRTRKLGLAGAGAAAAVAMAVSTDADAAIVSSGIQDVVVDLNTTNFVLDIDNDGGWEWQIGANNSKGKSGDGVIRMSNVQLRLMGLTILNLTVQPSSFQN